MVESTFEEQVQKAAECYKENGFAVIENFLTNEEIETLRKEARAMIDNASLVNCKQQVFEHPILEVSDYFITSGDKSRTFFEKNAVDVEKKELLVPKERSLAKIGHAVHGHNEVFKNLVTSEKMQKIFKAIEFIKPTLMQSMLIFKNPQVGGEYTPHQDATFLCTDPVHIAGAWMALDDATEGNGCLEFIPGSHKWPLARRFVKGKDEKTGETTLVWTAPPQEYDTEKFVAAPVKRGSLVLLDGLVVHRSGPNKSENSRWVYTLHAYDKGRCRYLEDNWLQEIDHHTMIELY